MSDKPENRIVLFDANCVLCNKSVQFILENDRSESIFVAPLRSDLGEKISKLQGLSLENISTVFYYRDGKIIDKSSAGLTIAKDMKNWISVIYPLILIPKFIRDRIYSWIANNRIKWFGNTEQCLIHHPRLLSGEL